MFKRLFLSGAVTIAALALLISQWLPPAVPQIESYRPGRNNTVLFLTNSDHGLVNVFMATAFTLLQQHPEVDLHWASFPSLAKRTEQIAKRARQKHPASRGITFHEVPDLNFLAALINGGGGPAAALHAPGVAGMEAIVRDMPFYTSPWTGEEHMTLFHAFTEIIDKVDPSLVVLDNFQRPAIDATRNRSRLHAFISPLTPVELFPLEQPYGSWLWKYPVMGSGISYPVPWSRLLENIYINLRYYYAMLSMSHFGAVQEYLISQGLPERVSWYSLRNPSVPFFTQALPGASVALAVTPENVTLTGPMILSLGPAVEQSPALVDWLARAPTMLVSLGSLFVWTEAQAVVMAAVVGDTLRANPALQILWKLIQMPADDGTTYSDEFLAPLRPYVENGRLKMVTWLDVQPVSLLETGHIVASVHHGGAGCYSEALATGTPQVVLPQWLDHYSFARLAQDIGVGVWGCPDASPYWRADCLREAFSAVLRGEPSSRIRSTAKEFGRIARSNPGEVTTAREIARLAASGS